MKSQHATDALNRATQGNSIQNDMRVVEAFSSRGIPEEDIRPRENVFTYHAWRALGRQVRKGEHGVRLPVFVTKSADKIQEDGSLRPVKKTFRKATTVFHVSQTDLIGG